jgi:hypothetical protein
MGEGERPREIERERRSRAERRRKEAEEEGAAGVPPARVAVAAPRFEHRRGALALPPCPFRERSGGRGREGKKSDEGEREEIFLPVYYRRRGSDSGA